MRYFSRIGALGDLLEWLNLDQTPYYVNQLMKGKMGPRAIAYEMLVKAPINVIAQGFRPFEKLAFELAARRALFPDIFKPSTIRDRGLHIARSFGLEREYTALFQKPSRGYAESLPQLFLYKSDPLEAAYWDIQDEKRRYLKGQGVDQGTGFWLTPRGDALYNLKAAIRYGDKKAADQYLELYHALGGKNENIRQSLDAMDPQNGLKTTALREGFKNYLDERGKQKLLKAIKYYEHLEAAAYKDLQLSPGGSINLMKPPSPPKRPQAPRPPRSAPNKTTLHQLGRL